MSESNKEPDVFRCPGETKPISRAMHLARLAAFSLQCRECPHRHDTAGISPQTAKRLSEVHAGTLGNAAFDNEGLEGVLLNELTPEVARRAASAFGLWLREQENTGSAGSDWPTVILSSDGRQATSPLVAAVAVGLRFAGCHVLDIGQTTAGCLVFAMHQSQAKGGLSIGSPGHRTHEAALRFWHDGKPLSRGAGLERIEAIHGGHLDRPTRKFGTLRRISLETDYLASLAEFYHGLRPLRIVLDTPCRPMVEYLSQLCRSLECQVFCDPSNQTIASDLISRHEAHLGMSIDGDGETILLFDERGEEISRECLLLLLAQHLLEQQDRQAIGNNANCPTIVVEEATTTESEKLLIKLGYRIVRTVNRRAEMCRVMEQEMALLGGGPSGRFWHVQSERATPDALVTLSCLLVILSQSDRPLSKVLDEAMPAE